MSPLILKLVLTPTLIGAASLAGRRWGPAVSGWLVGFPFTSAPIALVLALTEGPSFASTAAAGTMAGGISQAAFGVVYAAVALRGGALASLAAACAAFAVSTALLRLAALPLAALVPAVGIGLALAPRLMPTMPDASRARAVTLPRWDIPARMVVATAFVLALTGLAPALGARLTGLLAPFPLYAAVLTVFAHRLEGTGAAIAVLRGLLSGLFAFAAFFLVVAALVERAGIAPTFAAALVVVLAVQGLALLILRRRRAPESET